MGMDEQSLERLIIAARDRQIPSPSGVEAAVWREIRQASPVASRDWLEWLTRPQVAFALTALALVATVGVTSLTLQQGVRHASRPQLASDALGFQVFRATELVILPAQKAE